MEPFTLQVTDLNTAHCYPAIKSCLEFSQVKTKDLLPCSTSYTLLSPLFLCPCSKATRPQLGWHQMHTEVWHWEEDPSLHFWHGKDGKKITYENFGLLNKKKVQSSDTRILLWRSVAKEYWGSTESLLR